MKVLKNLEFYFQTLLEIYHIPSFKCVLLDVPINNAEAILDVR